MAFRYQLKSIVSKRKASIWQVVRSDGRMIFSSYDKAHAEAVLNRFNAWARQGWPYQPKVK